MCRPTARHFVIVAAVLIGGCGFKMAGSVPAGTAGSGGGGAAGGGGGGGSSGSGGAGGSGGAAGTRPPIIIDLDGGQTDGPPSTADANCGARSKSVMKVPPDILIVLDRSGSMNDGINNMPCRPDGGTTGPTMSCGPESKWALTIPAITQVVGETDTEVNWGLKFFPDNTNACNVNTTALVPIGPGNAAAIAAEIATATAANGGVVPFNGTPTRSAATGATTYMQTLTDMNPKFILLATDGLPTCPMSGAGGTMGGAGAGDAAGATAAVAAAATAGFPTFVVGIATAGGTADTTLSEMANAGGLPRMGTPSYYPVTSAADLSAAIRTLVGVAASCTFQIGPAPTTDGTTNLGKINVFGDGTEITRDPTHTNGYDYTDATMNAIQVHGPLCDQILSGAIRDVTVTFICLIT